MSSHPDPKDAGPEPAAGRRPDGTDSILALIWSMADTTWRMFTPPAIFVPAGIFIDLHFHTKPWVTLASAVFGLWMSVLLVKKQLGKTK